MIQGYYRLKGVLDTVAIKRQPPTGDIEIESG